MNRVLSLAAVVAAPLMMSSAAFAAGACDSLSSAQAVPVKAFQDGRVVRFEPTEQVPDYGVLFYEKREWPIFQATKREMKQVVASDSLRAVFSPEVGGITMQIVDLEAGCITLVQMTVVPATAAPKSVLASN